MEQLSIMPGFVDVSNMTAREVRLMDHAADADETYQPRQTCKSNARPTGVNHSVDNVWGAAVAANRINGGYVKDTSYGFGKNEDSAEILRRRNRDIMVDILANPAVLTVEDIAQGQECRKFLQNDLMFRTLKGKTNDFDNAVCKVLAVQDQFNNRDHKYELAIVACLPQSVERSTARQKSESRVQFAQGGLVGNIGDKIQLNAEVLTSNYSKQYNIYWVRAITDADQAVFFSNKESFDVGAHLTIKGTVKAHKDNLTQLNRVKVL